MKLFRILLFSTLLLCSGLLIYYLAENKNKTRFKSTLTPAFQLMGKSTKSINTALSKVIPVSELDEAEYGNSLKEYFMDYKDTTDKDYIYLNTLIGNLSKFSHRKFEYQVFLSNSSIPNAYALPGGVIIVTKGFMDIISTEAELVSVLGHEMGHIERQHCFNAVKYELLMKKINAPTLGQIADFTIGLLMRNSYSKTQENEADEYGYEMLLNTAYDPSGMSGAFEHLHEYIKGEVSDVIDKKANILRDYFYTHPPTELRIEKFQKDAENWWKYNQDSRRYKGIKNFKERICYYEKVFEEEWVNQ